MPQTNDKHSRKKLLPARRPVIQIAERQILQLNKILTQPKITPKMQEIQNPVLPEKSLKYIDFVDPVTKPIIKSVVTEIVTDQVSKFLICNM